MFHFLKLVFCKQQERVEKSMPNRGKKSKIHKYSCIHFNNKVRIENFKIKIIHIN